MGYPERMSEFRESDLPEQERVRRRQLDKLQRELRSQMDLEDPNTFIKGIATRIYTIAQENERLRADVQRLEPLAVLDSLIPDFFRHSYFQQLLEEEALAIIRMSQPTSTLTAIDLDEFGAFNERFSHPGGDQLLITVGAAIMRSIRGGDTPGRVGGDELAVIQRRITIDGAVAAAIRMQDAISQDSQAKFGDEGKQTVSVGICLIEPGYSVDLLREISDKALYAAKKAGKNKIYIGMYDLTTQSIKTIPVAPKINGGGK